MLGHHLRDKVPMLTSLEIPMDLVLTQFKAILSDILACDIG